MPKKKKKKDAFKKPASLVTRIVGYFNSNPRREFNVTQLAYQLGMKKKKDTDLLMSLLRMLTEQNIIVESDPWKFRLASQPEQLLEGTIEITKYGYAFVTTESVGEDIFIPAEKTGQAINGDLVRIKVVKSKKKGKKLEGEVEEVITRNQTSFVGVLQVFNDFAFMIPDNPKIHVDFFIPREALKDAKDGDKVVIEFTEWPEDRKNPQARVSRVLGKAGLHDVEMHAIIEEFSLPYKFPEAVIKESEVISGEIPESEIKARRDFRKVTTFTIDPEDAKDFDDAISYKKINDNLFEIGVHIADVTYYLSEGSLLDREALKRATSVYLVDRVIPMLPEKLSNFLCSLRPNEDKLCYAAVFEMDLEGTIYKEWYGRTIINSDRRFTYDQV